MRPACRRRRQPLCMPISRTGVCRRRARTLPNLESVRTVPLGPARNSPPPPGRHDRRLRAGGGKPPSATPPVPLVAGNVSGRARHCAGRPAASKRVPGGPHFPVPSIERISSCPVSPPLNREGLAAIEMPFGQGPPRRRRIVAARLSTGLTSARGSIGRAGLPCPQVERDLRPGGGLGRIARAPRFLFDTLPAGHVFQLAPSPSGDFQVARRPDYCQGRTFSGKRPGVIPPRSRAAGGAASTARLASPRRSVEFPLVTPFPVDR